METIKEAPQTKERRLTLFKDQLHFDIDNRTYKFTDAILQLEDNKVKNAVSSDVENTNDSSLLNRLTDDRDATIRKRLSFCLKDEEILELNNLPSEDVSYVYDFVLPVSFKDKNLKVLLTKMHEYIVEGSVLDWYLESGITGSLRSFTSLRDKVAALEDDIVGMIRMSGGDTRRPMQPFGPAM